YRIYRKLREKLKNLMAKGDSVVSVSNKFENEVNELCEDFKPPKPMEYYFKIALISMNFLSKNRLTKDKLDIGNKYIDFLNVIFECERNNKEPTLEMMQN